MPHPNEIFWPELHPSLMPPHFNNYPQLLMAEGDTTRLTNVTFGGARFDGLAVRLVEAGGPQDKRPWPGSDALRLGADFLSRHPSLWNFPARTITVLRPDAEFLAPR